MSRLVLLSILLACPAVVTADVKSDLAAAVDSRAEESWKVAKQIWTWAEPGYQETRSAKLLSDTLEQAGFRVTRGVAEIPTAFTATIGEGRPIIGILGEYDALPGLSQQAVPQQVSREDGNGYGHACGHHLFGVASMEAAIALGAQLTKTGQSGTVRFYGCPAEEGGAAKIFMVRDGLFADCDAVLHWHPGSRNSAGDASCLSRMAVKFRFKGTSAHAAGAPEQGRSSLDAVELTAHAAELLREHTPDFTRIHHTISAGGQAPNVVPDFAEVYFYVRHPQSEVVSKLYPRLVKCAEAGALATETKLEIEYLGGTMEILPNNTMAEVIERNLKSLADLKYNDEELAFAIRIRETLQKPVPLEQLTEVRNSSGETTKGSTDVGDVSWVVPTAGFSTACWVPGTPGHSWQAVAAGGTTLGRQGMLLAAKTLATSGWDLLTSPDIIAGAKAEHEKRRNGREYKAMLSPGQKPPLNYRNSPVP